MTSTLQALILCTSSITGFRLAMQMGIQASPRTLLWVVNHGERSVATPRVLGIDDFALHRGRTYVPGAWCDLPLPEIVRRRAEYLLYGFCQLRVPESARREYRLEFRVRGNAVTLYECHAPWRRAKVKPALTRAHSLWF